MKKEDRVVFSRFPAPGEKIVQDIYKGYMESINDIRLEFIRKPRSRYLDTRISIHKTRDGQYIPILSEPILLNIENNLYFQKHEEFFIIYRKLRARLIADILSRQKGCLITKYRIYAISGLVHLMNENEFDVDSLRLFTQLYNHPHLKSEELDPVFDLLQDLGYPRCEYWDRNGVIQQGWCEYVPKVHPKPKTLPPGSFVTFST